MDTLPSASEITSPPIYPMEIKSRVWERHAMGLQTACQPAELCGDNDQTWPAEIRDLSRSGVGLVLERRFEPGTDLAIEIPQTTRPPINVLLVRIVHATALLGGQWLLGCAFVEQLSEDELQRLLPLGKTSENDT